jgi:hypothetical protein
MKHASSNYYSMDEDDQEGDQEQEEETAYYYDPETGEYYEVGGREIVYPIVDEAEEYEDEGNAPDGGVTNNYANIDGFNKFSVNININDNSAIQSSPTK